MTRAAAPSDQQIADLHRDAFRFQERRKKVAKRAGRALTDPDSVLLQQSDAIDAFASENFSQYTHRQIAQAARRIARFSDMLDAAEDYPQAVIDEQAAKDRLRDARADAGINVAPVGGRSR